MKGLVIRSTGSWYTVRAADGNTLECCIKGRFRIEGIKNTNPVAVGDNVLYEFDQKTGKGVITRVEPRKNYIIRRSVNLSKQSHIIAANIDQAFLLATIVMPRTSSGFIDRFLVTAEAYGIPAHIVFGKTDLYSAEEKKELDQMKILYESIGYHCYEISGLTGTGINELLPIVSGKTTLVSGHSGVGKSSLINLLNPSLKLKTGELSVAHSKGIHTTTFAELHTLPNGGFIIDTPGIKEFGMFDMKREELSHFFPEMRILFNKCKFNSCLHINEPNCAVKQAVESGAIPLSRYTNYISIINGEDLKVKYD
ncbi:MAG: ribosome small subunit-dependent GTPase A [Bacteroidia bacterium]|nr:ribosome small subunit-dependent GTPase A [Bacteroidia bacterium]